MREDAGPLDEEIPGAVRLLEELRRREVVDCGNGRDDLVCMPRHFAVGENHAATIDDRRALRFTLSDLLNEDVPLPVLLHTDLLFCALTVKHLVPSSQFTVSSARTAHARPIPPDRAGRTRGRSRLVDLAH